MKMAYSITGASQCNEVSLCVDCTSKTCLHAGELMADCPKHSCDNNKLYDCKNCAWMKDYIQIARKEIRKKR